MILRKYLGLDFVSWKMKTLTLIQGFENCRNPLVGHEVKRMNHNQHLKTEREKTEEREKKKYQIISHILYHFIKYFLCECVFVNVRTLWVSVGAAA